MPELARLGLGLAALGRPGYINLGHGQHIADTSESAMRQNAYRVLDAAWEAGIRRFDAARSYGKAEAFLSGWLAVRDISPNDVFVSSKWGYAYTADWQVKVDGPHEVKDHSLAMLRRQWLESDGQIGQWLRLYQIHSATLETGVLENDAVLNELARLKAMHGVQIGLSLSGAGQAATLERALAVRVDGVGLFSSVQATYNVLERSTGELLQAAHDAGWTVMVKEALANGRLTPANDRDGFAEGMRLLRAEAERLNTTVDALGLAFVLARDWADVVLLGAARVDHLQSNVRAVDVAWDDAAESGLSRLVETPETYWRIRSDLEWN